jgi:filamentous hemagglutinin family protein
MGVHNSRHIVWRRGALFASTALSAALAFPAYAQSTIDPSTTPQGGVVVAGSSTITQAPGNTTVNQSSENTAIDWQSFNVGSNASVQFNQPNASAIALNRVTGGNLSQINGRIDANGQIVLINQSGVVFAKGSQVNAESVVVSTADISNKDFMAGHLNFTGTPNPGAKIINEGNITVKDAGLVGLVAPQVSNSGVITAQLGQVVLAGGTAFTLDLYGDRLISLDVTQAVRAVDVGGVNVPALVTNRGIIIANGGRVTLTAQDADALVTQLISAGGTIQADSVGKQAGAISIVGVGGNIAIAGNLLARGTASGSTGGTVEALTTGTVAVAPTASIDVSGQSGGGVVAIGTDIARAQTGASDTTAPKAAAVTIAAGATIAANATGKGKGGTVTLLSSQETDFGGAIAVQGGPLGGNGGVAEISSGGVISLGGTVLATAIDGQAGEILLDPQVLIVKTGGNAGSVSGGGTITFGGFDNGASASMVDPGELNSLSGTVILEASKLVSVASAIDMTNSSVLSLVSEGSISITAGITVDGSLDLDASGALFIGSALDAHDILLTSGAAGTDIDASVTASTGVVTLGSTGAISEDSANGTIIAATLLSAGTIGGDVSLANNTLAVLGGFTSRDLTLANAGGLTVGGSVSAGNIVLSAASLTFEAGLNASKTLHLISTGTISQGFGTISAGTLLASAAGNFDLRDTGNAIANLGSIVVTGGTFDLADTGSLAVVNTVSASDVTIAVPTLSLAADIVATNTLAIAANDLAVSAGAFDITGSGGAFDIAPFSANTVIDIGSASSFGTLGLPALVLAAFDNSTANIHIGKGPAGALASGIDIDSGVTFLHAAAVDLSTSGAILDNSGKLTATLLEFDAAGFTQSTTAAIDVGTLQGDGGAIGNSVLLAGLSNNIGTLGGMSLAAGTLALTDSVALLVAGSVTAPDIYLTDGSAVVPDSSIGLTGTLVAGSGGTIGLTADALGIPSGTPTIAASGGLVVIAPYTGNKLIDFGGTSEGGLELSAPLVSIIGANELQIGNGHGVIDQENSFGVAAQTLALDGTTINILGTLAGPGLLLLDAGANVSEGATQILDFATIAGTAGGSIALLGAANSFANLGEMTAGNISLADQAGLTLTAPVDATLLHGTIGIAAGAVTAEAASTLTAGNITLSGTTIALSGSLNSGGAVQLDATGGDITESGAISAQNLSGSASGNATLNGNNNIFFLGNFSAGTFALTDARSPLGLTGLLTASTATLIDNLGINEGTGTISVTTLNAASTNGDVDFGTATRTTIATLGSIDIGTGNTLTVKETSGLGVGSLTAGAADLTASSITFTGDAGVTSLNLAAAGSITQTGGTIAAGTLAISGSMAGAALFPDAGNAIDNLAGFTLGGTLELADSNAPLTILGTVITPGIIELSGTSLTESGGALSAATLTTGSGSFSGAVSLAGANTIGTLDGFLAGGAFLLADTEALDIAGLVSSSGGITLADTGGGITELTGGALSGTTLSGSAAGNVTLTNDNNLTALNNFTVTAPGTLNLNDAGALTIGNATASFTTISAGAITLSGALSAANELVLASANGISQTAGEINAGTLSGASTLGNVILTLGNSIAALGDFTLAGTFDLADDIALTILDPLTAADILIAASSIAIDSTLAAGTLLALAADTFSLASGQLQAPGGTIDIAPFTTGKTIDLGGSISGDVNLLPAFVAALDPTAADIVIGQALGRQAGAITITGSSSFGSTLLELTPTGAIAESGTLIANTLAFSGTGFSQSAAGALDAALLRGDGAIAGAVDLTSTLNSIAALGSINVSGADLALTDAEGLTESGPVSADNITLIDSSSLALNGNLTAATGDTINLIADSITGSGSIAAPGGTVAIAPHTPDTAIDLGGTNTGLDLSGAFISLISASVLQIGSADGFDGGALTVDGPLTIAPPTLRLSGTGIAFNGALTEAGLLSFVSTGDVHENSGAAITAGTLTGSGGTIALGGANKVGTLGNVTTSTDLTFGNTLPLLITEVITASGAVTLEDTGAITETTGLIDAASFNTGGATIGGNLDLGNGNSIATLGAVNVAAADSFNFTDAEALTVAGPVIAPNITLSGIGMTIAGTIDAASTLALASSGAITETTGIVKTGSLVSLGTIGGNVSLGNTNSIATLGSFTVAAGDMFDLHDAGLLTVAGPLTAGTATLSAGTIAIAGSIDAATLLALGSSGAIAETGGGTITAGTLASSGTIGGNLSLANTNTITTVGNITLAAGGAFTLLDSGLLTVAGTVAAPAASLNAGSIVIAGAITGTSLALQNTTGVTETSGIISEGTFASQGGPLALLNGNTIGALGSVGSTGNIALNDTSDLSLTSLVSTAGMLTLGDIGNITETTGTIAAGTLASFGTIGGNVSLANGNSIGTLGDLSLAGNFVLDDTGDLAIAGLLATPKSVTFADSGSITETTGGIDAGTLASNGTIGGNVALGNTNSIATLAAFTVAAGDTFDLADTGLLTVAGPLVAPTATLSAGTIAVTGSIDVPGLLALTSPGSIFEQGGGVTTGTLTSGGATDGALALADAADNHIGTLGAIDIAAGGSLDIADTGLLTVAGPIDAPAFVTLNAGSIVLAGLIQAGQLALAATGGATETTGSIDAGTFSSSGGPLSLLNGNSIVTISGIAASGGIAFKDTTSLTLTGNITTPGTLTLENTAAITQTGGTIGAAQLTSGGTTIGGAVSLMDANNIPVLGNFAAAGLALTDTGLLTLAGNVDTGADALNLQTTGAIDQTAGSITAGLLDAGATNISLPGDNSIAALGTVSTGNLLVYGVNALDGPVTATNATLTAPQGNFNLDGPATISNALYVYSPHGDIDQTAASGPVTAATASFTAGGAIDLSGTTEIADALFLSATGNITQGGGVLDAGTLSGNAGGLARFGAIGGGAGTADFGTISTFTMTDSLFELNNAGTLALVGPLTADQVSITVLGFLNLDGTDGGGLFITGGTLAPTVFAPTSLNSVITVEREGNLNPTISQTGTFTINSPTTPATLFLTANDGDISFAPAPPTTGGLIGPAVDVELSAGKTGTISGNVDLFRVVILSAEQVNLTGILDRVGGQAGAGNGLVDPFPQPSFRFNACPIGSVNCTILPVESLPAADPLQNFEIDQRKKRKLNHNVQLPGIATRDF